jgi:hypothetical protein
MSMGNNVAGFWMKRFWNPMYAFMHSSILMRNRPIMIAIRLEAGQPTKVSCWIGFDLPST